MIFKISRGVESMSDLEMLWGANNRPDLRGCAVVFADRHSYLSETNLLVLIDARGGIYPAEAARIQ